MQQPDITKKRFISPVWFLPFLALCIGSWLLYTSYRDAGIDITIHFATADGITPGKTKVIYKGIPVGTVKTVAVDATLQGVDLEVEMDKRTLAGLVEDTKFWVVRPEVSAGRISGLETLLSGSYIAVKKGSSSTPARSFTGLSEAPPPSTNTPGLHITLKTPTLYSLQKGSHVYSKNLQIGQVTNYTLEQDGLITLQLLIQPKFSHLIQENTRFWNSSGLSVSGDLQSGMTVNMESLSALIYGGITCATPPAMQESPPAQSGHQFTLYKDFEHAEYGIPMTLQLASGDGIVEGKTRIIYRGLKAGVVKSLAINNDQFHTVTASILLDPRAEVILRQDTRFWVIRPQVSLEGVKNLETLITGSYITFQPGGGNFQDHFIIEPNPMPTPTLRPGTRFALEAAESGSLEIGAPILYRQLVVGEITDITLNKDGQSVQTTILVYSPYDRLVQPNSVFWNVSGVQIDASLSNIKVNLSSMRTMIAGGITFTTPGDAIGSSGTAVPPDTVFTLYEGYHEAVKHEDALKTHGLTLSIQTRDSASVQVGSPVLYSNIRVGEIMKISFKENSQLITIDLLLFDKFRHLANGSSRFYNQSGIKAEASLQGITLETGPLEAIISGGVSFITPEKNKKIKPGQRFPLYKDREAAENADNIRLTLRLHSAKGMGRHTKIRYQGIEIGHLTKVYFNQDLDQVLAHATVNQGAKKLFRTDSKLYLVGPQIDLSGIQNLDTILSGTYISLRPGTGEPAKEFNVLPQAPGRSETYAGLNIILESETLGSLKPGRPIYYRQVPVGLITGYELSTSGRQVWINANIMPEYEHLVRSGTRFWNVSGVEITGGVFGGMSISTESMESLITGGVAFATPEGEAMGTPVTGGEHFMLADKAAPDWRKWAPDLATYPHITPETKKTRADLEINAEPAQVTGNEDSTDL